MDFLKSENILLQHFFFSSRNTCYKIGCGIFEPLSSPARFRIGTNIPAGKKGYGKPQQRIIKQDITLLTKVCIVKAVVFQEQFPANVFNL